MQGYRVVRDGKGKPVALVKIPGRRKKKGKGNEEYLRQLLEYLPTAPYHGALKVYDTMLNDPHLDPWVVRELGKHDRYFLLTMILHRSDAFHPWIYERCREVEKEPDGVLDLWAREHYKSTIITFAGIIQEILKDPEITIGIFSHTRPIAKAFLRQIKHEFETNDLLKKLYPDILWQNPKKEAPVWSLDDGIVVKRKSNPNVATVEAWGLVDSQPTSKHFKLMIYDDVVTQESVTTPEMIQKTTKAWELSQFLASQNKKENEVGRAWHIGTRYHYADTYKVMIDRGMKTRIYPATKDGTYDGEPVLLSPEQWEEKKRKNSIATIACQMLLNPLAGSEKEFDPKWIRYYELRPETLNVAILVDPASSKKRESSNTAFAVIGIDRARNKYLLDGACHKMNLTERWEMLKRLREKWLRQPGIQTVVVGYERYGMQSDIEHFEEMMKIEGKMFPIQELSWPRDSRLGAKDDRIRRLIPDHQNWRFFYPHSGPKTKKQIEAEEKGKGFLIAKPIKAKDENGKLYDVVEKLIQNEYLFFPATNNKDMLDAMSRIYDVDLNPPQIYHDEEVYPEWAEDF